MSQSKAAPTPEPSEIAGRYQVVQKLGAGAFGTVYKAKDNVLDRMVAIKTIRLEGLAAAGTDLEELLTRFQREAKNSAKLKHPNIVTIYDFDGNADGLSYIAMEFIDGTGLEKVIAQGGRLPVERAASLAAQVADALDFAHRHSVVHRDIKPANIMVEAGDRVKVTDFGIAKATDSAEHLTMTGSLLGTPSYMSPEQAKGAQIDGRSDLFSLGCVLYEMLGGKKAFRGESITALIFKIITEEPPDIRGLDPGIPEEMVRIVTKALSKAPETRYQTGRELADDLQALTRAGFTPTLREVEATTARSPAPASATVRKPGLTGAPPTAGSPPTISSSPTVAGRSAPPTQLSPAPPTRIAPPAGAAQREAPSPPARAEAPRRAGSGAGLMIGLGLAGLLFVAVAAGAGWYLFVRQPAPTVAEDAPAPAPVEAPGVPVASPETQALDSAAPASQSAAAEAAVPPGSAPGATAPSRVAPVAPAPVAPTRTAEGPPRPRPGPAGAAREGPASGQATRPSSGPAPDSPLAFLDSDEPLDVTDGRSAGEALARKYQSDQGSSSASRFGATGRFRPRDRNPRPQGPVEVSAIRTLRYIIDNEEAFHRKSGRYGTLKDLFTAQLPLDVPHTADSFQRRGYRFSLEISDGGYRVTAMPAQPGSRPFTGDDSGIIRPGFD